MHILIRYNLFIPFSHPASFINKYLIKHGAFKLKVLDLRLELYTYLTNQSKIFSNPTKTFILTPQKLDQPNFFEPIIMYISCILAIYDF